MASNQRRVAKEAFWREIMKRQSVSNLSARAFCLQEGLTETTFYSWRRTIAARDSERVPAAQSPPFVPATVTSPPERESTIAIELAGGLVLRLPASTSTERLAELVHALDSRSAQ